MDLTIHRAPDLALVSAPGSSSRGFWSTPVSWLSENELVLATQLEVRARVTDPDGVSSQQITATLQGGGTAQMQLTQEPNVYRAVVNAAGPWARPLAEQAGLEMPLRSVREQDSIWQARGSRPLPETSVSNAVDAIYLRPMGEGRFLIGQGFPKEYVDVDPYNYRETAEQEFVEVMLERATRRFPPLEGMTLITAYAALYDVTPDWYPFIGPRTGLDGYYDACGGSGHGFKIGPAIGRALADWIVDGETTEGFAGLSHDRLAAGRLFTGAYGGNRG